MKRIWSGHSVTDYLHEPPDPKPVNLNTFVLEAMGFVRQGSEYTKSDMTIKYDGVDWWFSRPGYDHQQQDFLMKTGILLGKCNTVQELEKLMK